MPKIDKISFIIINIVIDNEPPGAVYSSKRTNRFC